MLQVCGLAVRQNPFLIPFPSHIQNSKMIFWNEQAKKTCVIRADSLILSFLSVTQYAWCVHIRNPSCVGTHKGKDFFPNNYKAISLSFLDSWWSSRDDIWKKGFSRMISIDEVSVLCSTVIHFGSGKLTVLWHDKLIH